MLQIMTACQDFSQRPCIRWALYGRVKPCLFRLEQSCTQLMTSRSLGCYQRTDNVQQDLLSTVWPDVIEAHGSGKKTPCMEEEMKILSPIYVILRG